MKIGLVCPYSIARGGGVKEVVYAQQAELLRRGHEAIIITPRPRDCDDESARREHMIFVGTGTELSSPLHTTGQVSAGLNEEIDAMLAEHNFDVLHFHEPWVPMLSRQILSRSNTLHVATFHAALPGTMVSRTFMKVVAPYTKSILKYIHAYTATSEASAEYISALSGAPVSIIPIGVDLKMYKAPTKRDDTKPHKTIFYVGRLENRKGVKYLVQAFALLQQKHPDTSLVIAGNGPDRNKLELLAQNLNVQNVTFTGFISDEQKVAHLRSADLFCSPALYGEGFGVVLLEAMTSGLVTVAGNNPGYASVMQGLGSVSLVNPKDTPEFARRLELLLYQQDLRDLWREWAKSQLPMYDYRAIVNQFEEVYQQVIADHAAAKESAQTA